MNRGGALSDDYGVADVAREIADMRAWIAKWFSEHGAAKIELFAHDYDDRITYCRVTRGSQSYPHEETLALTAPEWRAYVGVYTREDFK